MPLHERADGAGPKPDSPTPWVKITDVMSGLEFTRSELVRQRHLLRGVWWWYLLPFVPGMLLIHVGYSLEHPESWYLRAVGIFVAVTFVGIGLLNQRVA